MWAVKNDGQLMKQRRKQTFGQNVCEVSVFILYRCKSTSCITAWNRWWRDDDDDDFSNVTFTERAACPAYLKRQPPLITSALCYCMIFLLSIYHRLTYILFILFIAISTPTRFQLDGKLHQGRDEMNCINCGIKEEKATWES